MTTISPTRSAGSIIGSDAIRTRSIRWSAQSSWCRSIRWSTTIWAICSGWWAASASRVSVAPALSFGPAQISTWTGSREARYRARSGADRREGRQAAAQARFRRLMPAEFAPARSISLCMSPGRRPDGYHLLDSLVAFAAIGDRRGRPLPRPASRWRSPARSPAISMPAPPIWFCAPPHRCLKNAAGLTRHLPVASGIGGGSADAAHTFAPARGLWSRPLPDEGRAAWSRCRSAGLPLAGRATRMSGIGERLDPVPLPPFWLVLANPGVPVPTGAVFAGLARRDNPADAPAPRLRRCTGVLRLPRRPAQRSQTPALALAPAVAERPRRPLRLARLRFARMSGSGGDLLALFAADAPRAPAVAALRRAAPWWVAAAPPPSLAPRTRSAGIARWPCVAR